MAKNTARTHPASLMAVALASAGVVGAAWLMDALRRDREMHLMHRRLVDLLLNALTADDPVTARHSRRVADLSFALAQACGRLPRREMATLRVGALLHDMGKIDDRFFTIVHSRKRLSPEQRAEIKHHPHQSAAILQPLEELHPGIQRVVSSHHECWDGSGYPCGLVGEDIPLAARIITLADVFDAMTQPRKYKDPMPLEEAIEKLDEGSGRQFDPHLVELIENGGVLPRWTEIARRGLEDELCHLRNPNATEQAIEEVAEEAQV